VIVDCAVYEDGRRREGQVPLEDAYEAGREENAFVWIGLHEPTREEFDSVARKFNLHQLAVEDAINAHQRPKVETYGDSLFMVLQPARYKDREELVETGEILLFVGEDFVVSVRHGDTSALADVRGAFEEHREFARCGPVSVVHAIVDRVVDDYLPVLEGLDVDIQEIEADVFSPVRTDVERIYRLKREIVDFHRATSPLVEPVRALSEGRYPMVPDELRSYFRDVLDHLLRVADQVDGFSDALTNVLHANLAQVTVGQAEDTRRISAWVAIIAVPTMIAGIYGMNFENMPELRWTYGYFMVLAVIAVACATLYWRFRRSGWL
jgi:magnesium transporter